MVKNAAAELYSEVYLRDPCQVLYYFIFINDISSANIIGMLTLYADDAVLFYAGF